MMASNWRNYFGYCSNSYQQVPGWEDKDKIVDTGGEKVSRGQVPCFRYRWWIGGAVALLLFMYMATCNFLPLMGGPSQVNYSAEYALACRFNHSSQNVTPSKLLPTCSNSFRLTYMERQCSGLYDNSQITDHVYYDHENHVFYCQISKNGCSTIKAAMSIRRGQVSKDFLNLHIDRIHYLVDHGWTGIDSTIHGTVRYLNSTIPLEKYYKFVVWRHPFKRLYSFYKNKFMEERGYYMWRFLIPYYRFLRLSNPGWNLYYGITFHQLLRTIAMHYEHGFRDRHWRTQVEQCAPCSLQYDYVARMETLSDDLPVLLPKLGIPELPHLNPTERLHDWLYPPRSLDEELKSVPDDIMDKLMGIYQLDMRLLGYSWTPKEGLGCDMGGCC